MTEPEPKLDAPTLRWAAQHIRKFMVRAIDGPSVYANDAYELSAESMERWAVEADMADAKRKSDPGCTCSPSPGAGVGDMLCPSCAAVEEGYSDAEELRSCAEWASRPANPEEPALTVDQATIDEHYGRIAYEAWHAQLDARRKSKGLGCWGHTRWDHLDSETAFAWIAAAKAVRDEPR